MARLMQRRKAVPTKRIVLVHTTGVHAGLSQILGTVEHLRARLHVAELPEYLDPVQFLDHVGACSLVKAHPRYVLYREVFTPTTVTPAATFHPDQR